MDNFGRAHDSMTDPGRRHWPIVPGPNPQNPMPRALYANTAGTVTIVDEQGTRVDYNVVASQVLPFRAFRITAATASLIGWE